MKKLLLLFLAATLVFVFTACEQTTNVYLDWDGNVSADIDINVGNTSSQEDSVVSESTSTEEESVSSGETTSSGETASNNSSSDTQSKKPVSSTPKEDSKPTTSSTPQAAIEYTVTFNPDNGSKSSTQKTSGGKVSTPANPQKSGHNFLGWYKEGANKAWDFSSKISSDMTLTARWELIEYTVTFDPKNGNSTFKDNTVNNIISVPEAPKKEGFAFLGWYKEGANKAWDFSSKISSDITLIARWDYVEYTVTFDPDNGEPTVPVTTVEHKVSKPADPEKKKNEFKGWYIQNTSTKWDFSQDVTGDITLVARWELAGDHSPIIPF